MNPLYEPNKANKTDAGNGSYGICRVIDASRSPSPDPKRSPEDMNSWPFDQPENCAVFTTTHVLKEGHDIAYVFHDADDHGWQFHYAGEKSISDSMVVCLSEMVFHDPTVLEVADLPPGWKAWRKKKGDAWQRTKNPHEEGEPGGTDNSVSDLKRSV